MHHKACGQMYRDLAATCLILTEDLALPTRQDTKLVCQVVYRATTLFLSKLSKTFFLCYLVTQSKALPCRRAEILPPRSCDRARRNPPTPPPPDVYQRIYLFVPRLINFPFTQGVRAALSHPFLRKHPSSHPPSTPPSHPNRKPSTQPELSLVAQ